ncbi:hypothetical protein AYR62_08125 [Secundilactobacillus paracollinoides]|uniref:Uncharacterized protein n=1 Tax=Secundilactobacillus paracollinoides TaxID=240427 RepID=A0A1B2IZI6_9LACO|nr:hypothetical protein AYR61_09500 [Secundilactobacillus paracollinoides]ANZ64046.1 hypothetical protein AYR62_08125 [Secundilactobacillus paracollinoides]ANZ67486.1 hypothetical protein AYR63_10250 [Secundilactobacillus paracollinoides]
MSFQKFKDLLHLPWSYPAKRQPLTITDITACNAERFHYTIILLVVVTINKSSKVVSLKFHINRY